MCWNTDSLGLICREWQSYAVTPPSRLHCPWLHDLGHIIYIVEHILMLKLSFTSQYLQKNQKRCFLQQRGLCLRYYIFPQLPRFTNVESNIPGTVLTIFGLKQAHMNHAICTERNCFQSSGAGILQLISHASRYVKSQISK